jgi:hypothetical protein
MKLEVSVGEAIDKFSILEIKLKHITDEIKRNEIMKEMIELQECNKYIDPFFYKLLVDVNQKIWDLTNKIKVIDVSDISFSIISKDIFDYNQKRFRIKNWFNILYRSEINEQKSYDLTYCKICISNEKCVYDKITEIYGILLEYDIVVFDTPFVDTIKKLIKVPTYFFANDKQIETEKIIYI